MGFLPFFSALVASHGAFRKYRPHEKQKKQKTLKVVTSSSNLSSPSFRAENQKNKIAIEDGETLCLALHCDSTLNVWLMCVSVWPHVVKHSCGAKRFSCRQDYFPVRCMPLVDQGGLFLEVGKLWPRLDLEKKKERKTEKRDKTATVWSDFFNESNLQ